MPNSRWTAKSHWAEPKLRSPLRCRLPCPTRPVFGSIGGGQNGPTLEEPSGHPPATAPGVLLIAFPPGYCGPYKYKGTPATTFGRTAAWNPFGRGGRKKEGKTTLTGGAD